jgi:cystathionine gamma-synthase
VERVHYPGVGGIVSAELRGDAATAERVTTATALWVHATSLGGVESSLERRRRWAGESADVPETLVRLSVGVEDVDDLWADLAAALGSATDQG